MADRSLVRIERLLELRARPERVWQALTDDEELASWFSDGASLEASPGAAGSITYDAVGRYSITIAALEPGRLLTWEFGYAERPSDGAVPQSIEWRLASRPDGGTTLSLVVSFQDETARAENEQGWRGLLAALQAHLEEDGMNTLTTDIPAIERRLELVADQERVWRALTDPAELGSWFTDRADYELREGALGWLEWTEHGRFAIRVERVDSPQLFSFSGARDPDTAVDDGPTTMVEFTLEASPRGGTILTVRESGFQRPEERSDNVHGWFGTWEKLAHYLALEGWQAGIRRTYRLRSAPLRVWEAFADPAQFTAWFGGQEPVELQTGAEGWFVWPREGRFAMRVDVVEPARYLAWSWATEPDVRLEEAPAVLHTEWLLLPRQDGGTDLELLETGFRGPRDHGLNESGWDSDVIPGLRKVIGEA